MAIVPVNYLQREMKPDTDDTNSLLTRAIEQAGDFVDGACVNYEEWPDFTTSGGVDTVNAPPVIERYCLQVAKAYYYLSVGVQYRDGTETRWDDLLIDYNLQLRALEVEPTASSTTISVNSDGVQLIARNQHILRFHPLCRVESATTNVWNQCIHWDIRKGNDNNDEQFDGWYFDASSYTSSIEGTLYYVRSWRNDGLDYQKYLKTTF